MAIFVEGIGGTGKAVINLLAFSTLLARLIGEKTPDLSFVVIDQDDQGVWPGVQQWKAAPGVGGQFSQAIGLVHQTSLAAAGLLFTSSELNTEISMGFHGHPKLLAALRHLWVRPPESQLATHVVIYSDIGGTGAGLGPVRLKDLVSTPGKRNVVGIIFGKYLDRGAVNPTGFRWLTDEVRLPSHAKDRSFTAFYLTTPMFQVPAGVPPSSGLNPTPALLLAVEYLWELGLADDGGLAGILGLNDRAVGRESVERGGFDTPHFQLRASDTFVARLRKAGLVNNFAAVLNRSQEYLHTSLTKAINADELRQECWRVYTAPEPRGVGDTVGEDLASAFAETFASVPDPWAAARWFHIAVARDVARCREALFRLLVLYLQGDLKVVATDWTLDGSDQIYALCTEALEANDPAFITKFRASVVGAFSETYPFWTVPECEGRLKALDLKTSLDGVSLIFARTAPSAEAYFTSHVTQVDISNVPNIKETVTLLASDNVLPSRWQWALEKRVSGWDELARLVDSWRLIGQGVSVRSGNAAFDASAGSHTCEVGGVRRVTKILRSDAIFADDTSGQEFYELVVRDQTSGKEPAVQKARRMVTEGAQANVVARIIDGSAVDILVGNVVLRLKLP